tara:strand:+ start:519 stop:2480 length:1962 start_codon:yes stop_codon:yes gene_type:complete
METFYTPTKINIASLKPKTSFSQLTEREKRYVYHLYRASQYGIPIIASQVSEESEKLIRNLVNFFTYTDSRDVLIIFNDIGEQFLNYVAMVFFNNGNYKSFGDSKFIPRISKEKFMGIINHFRPELTVKFLLIIDKIYSLNDNEKYLGMPPNNQTEYFKGDFDIESIDTINKFMKKNDIEPWNTRCEKLESTYTIKIASEVGLQNDFAEVKDGKMISVRYGDYNRHLSNVTSELELASQYVENDEQKKMLKHYINHFRFGKIEDHKLAQKSWVKDVNPVVEMNMGFIENYRDPDGTRAEFQSFVSIVNKKESLKYEKLVSIAPMLLTKLPWDNKFEREVFKKPNFTSLEIISFVGSGIPAGINIPNYYEIREKVGFKNVTLANVTACSLKNSYGSNDFLSEEDNILFSKHFMKTWDIHVAGHELLGHGSGKLYYSPIEGFNTHYNKGDTYSSIFGSLSSAYEECKAECVGLLSTTWKEMHKIFESPIENYNEVVTVSFLSMIKMGINSLTMYDPKNKVWKQAHSHARFVILNALREIPDFISLIYDNNDLEISIDKSKILTKGVEKINELVEKLQIYKSVADFESGEKLFNKYSEITNEYVLIKKIVESKQKPRTKIIQPTLVINKFNKIDIIEYDDSIHSAINSYVKNYIMI